MPTPYYPSRWLITSPGAADDPDVFPYMVGQTFLQLKTPQWSTKIDTSVSGRERRRALWSYTVWRFKVAYDVLRDTPAAPDLDRLYAFFNAHLGPFQEWFFWDKSDNAVVGQSFGYGDGATTTFQLTRSITVGAISCTEPVFALSGTPTVQVNGVTTSVTVGSKGKVTFATAPASGALLTWSGNFFFVCRFGNDALEPEQLIQGLWSSQGIEFQTVKQL